jgi:hypothetical protein
MYTPPNVWKIPNSAPPHLSFSLKQNITRIARNALRLHTTHFNTEPATNMPSSNDPSPIAHLNLNKDKDKVDEIIARKRANIDPAKAAIYAAMSDDEL